jgi:hypothetical protein
VESPESTPIANISPLPAGAPGRLEYRNLIDAREAVLANRKYVRRRVFESVLAFFFTIFGILIFFAALITFLLWMDARR